MIIDTHAHLADEKFDADRGAALQRALDAGVAAVIEIADNEDQWPKARALAEAHPGRVWWTAGCHPHHADRFDPGLPARLKAALAHPQAVAVGEIGLDYFRNPLPPDVQKRTFTALLHAALEADKPVVIHCREADKSSRAAQDDMLEIFKKTLGRGAPRPHPAGVLHCFQGNLEFARACLDMGFLAGVDGPLTYPKADDLHALFQELPLDRIVLETDCPYLPPQNRRGQRNEPAYLPAVAEELARLKNVPLSELRSRTTANALRLYRITLP